jgi:hypothetical protein
MLNKFLSLHSLHLIYFARVCEEQPTTGSEQARTDGSYIKKWILFKSMAFDLIKVKWTLAKPVMNEMTRSGRLLTREKANIGQNFPP